MLPRAVGIYAGILFLIAIGLLAVTRFTSQPPPPECPGRKVSMPALALEFAETQADLECIIGKRGNQQHQDFRDHLARNIRFDYGFIVLYTLLFVGIAAVLWRRGEGWAPWVAAAAIVTALAAAGFDVEENRRMLVVLNEVSLVRDVASVGFLKWLFSFLTLALLSFTFFGRGGWAPAGVACLAVAALGFAGLVMIRAGVQKTGPVEVAFGLMMFVLLPLVSYALAFAKGAFGRG